MEADSPQHALSPSAISDRQFEEGISVQDVLDLFDSQVIGMLSFIKDNLWKTMFGKPADSLEKSTEKEDECEYLIS